jgi:hypothetical protein
MGPVQDRGEGTKGLQHFVPCGRTQAAKITHAPLTAPCETGHRHRQGPRWRWVAELPAPCTAGHTVSAAGLKGGEQIRKRHGGGGSPESTALHPSLCPRHTRGCTLVPPQRCAPTRGTRCKGDTVLPSAGQQDTYPLASVSGRRWAWMGRCSTASAISRVRRAAVCTKHGAREAFPLNAHTGPRQPSIP